MRLRLQFWGGFEYQTQYMSVFKSAILELKTAKHVCGYIGCLVTYSEKYIQESAYI